MGFVMLTSIITVLLLVTLVYYNFSISGFVALLLNSALIYFAYTNFIAMGECAARGS